MLKPQFKNTEELYLIEGDGVMGSVCDITTSYDEAKKFVTDICEDAAKWIDAETRITTEVKECKNYNYELWIPEQKRELDEDDDPEEYPEWIPIDDCDGNHMVRLTITRLI